MTDRRLPSRPAVIGAVQTEQGRSARPNNSAAGGRTRLMRLFAATTTAAAAAAAPQ